MPRDIRKPYEIGQAVGGLSITSSHRKVADGYEYEAICQCGRVVTKNVKYLRTSPFPSCGCYERLAKGKNGKKTRTHGLTVGNRVERKLYDVYRQMIRRCYNPNSRDYPAWGGRGITVCQDWIDDVHSFVRWAKDSGYRIGVTIERRNNGAGYSPENCTWIPNEHQARNTRRIRWIEARGKRMSVADWSRETGMPYRRIMSRLNMGWTDERAVS